MRRLIQGNSRHQLVARRYVFTKKDPVGISHSQQSALSLANPVGMSVSVKKELLDRLAFSEDAAFVLRANIAYDDETLRELVVKVKRSKYAALVLSECKLAPSLEKLLMRQITNASDTVIGLRGGNISDENALLLINGGILTASANGFLELNQQVIASRRIDSSDQATEILVSGLVRSEEVQKRLIGGLDNSRDAAKVLIRGNIIPSLKSLLIKELSMRDIVLVLNEAVGDVCKGPLLRRGRIILSDAIDRIGSESGRDNLAAFIDKLRPQGFFLGDLEHMLEKIDCRDIYHEITELTTLQPNFPNEEFGAILGQISREIDRNDIVDLAIELKGSGVDVRNICQRNPQGQEILQKVNGRAQADCIII